MPGISLDAYEGMEDPAPAWRFEFHIQAPPAVDFDSQALLIRCQQAALPGMSTETMTVGAHGHERNFAGRRLFDKQFGGTFIETRSGVVSTNLRNWMELSRSTRTGNGAPSSEYMSSCWIYTVGTDGGIIHKIQVFRVWIQDMPTIQLDGTSSQPILFAPIFSYDYFRQDGVEYGSAGEEPTV